MNDLSEKEQLDELRTWWRENRAWVLGGIGIGVAAIAGFRLWTAQQVDLQVEASSQYEALLEAVAEDEVDEASGLADGLTTTYAGTAYADQARLAMARLYMDRGRDADAAAMLRPLAGARGNEPLQLVARLRLARILLYQDKPQEVLALLEKPTDSAFAARYNEAIGDAHFALGNMDEAAAAYNAVLADVRGQQTIDAALVRMKLQDLPEAGTADEAPAAAPAADDAEPATDDTGEPPADDDTGEADE